MHRDYVILIGKKKKKKEAKEAQAEQAQTPLLPLKRKRVQNLNTENKLCFC
jgi:hypothetical protein